MPPVLSRKRSLSDLPPSEPSPKRARAKKSNSKPKPPAPARRSKVSVFETLDAAPKVKRTLSQTKALLEQEGDDSDLSEEDTSEDEFEDVLPNGENYSKGKGKASEDSDESEVDDWEDALGAHHHTKPDHGPTPVISGDIALTLSAAPRTAFETKPDGKKGPSKVQRQIRNATHCIHVQYLMYHNLTRNAWLQDKEVQKILVEGMPAGCWRELEQYWKDAGIQDGHKHVVVQKATPPLKKEVKDNKGIWKSSGKKGVEVFESPLKRAGSRDNKNKHSKGKEKATPINDRKARDWGATSEPLEPNTPNMSAGDPLIRLMKYLSAYWKAKFRIITPSLRKRGYLSPAALEAEISAWKDDFDHPHAFGERVESLDAFRSRARNCEGSRDLGQQLFTALVRGLGIEARMVVSLQPVGFGWSQSEEGKPKNIEKLKRAKSTENTTATNGKAKKDQAPVDADTDDSNDLSSVISISSDEEDRPVKKPTRVRKHDEELPYPTYWTEAISHLTHTSISVSPFAHTLIATSGSPTLTDFYARGAAADKARQVLAYLIAFSSDNTAKDVTTRYLPKHQWPGRTKGFRMPVEKIPIHNKRGKVKRWEEWDWFKSVMRSYARPHNKRQPWDEVEDEGDLVPAEPERKKTMDEEGGKETLQGYKNSAEYVLERHLRREEALEPNSKIIRHFVTGKGDNEKSEPVYRRKDVVSCKTQESWHKEGREVRSGQQPLKLVPMRAVTVNRKREIEERERQEGEKVKQGLYSQAQTDWIIPDPIVDGKIPRNAFGNIDVYVPTMVPRGSVHVPLKGTARICRKLNIDYAEACTGFEFGKQRAVPVLTGVVVAEDNENMLIDAWEVEEAEKQRKAREKQEKFLLGLWRRFASGLRILERMREEYGDDAELPVKPVKAPVVAPKDEEDEERRGGKKSQWEVFQDHTDFEGGFVRDDAGPSGGGLLPEMPRQDEDIPGGFLAASQDDPVPGDLMIDHGERKEESRTPVAENAYRAPISLTQALQQPARNRTDEDKDMEDRDPEDDDDEEDGVMEETSKEATTRRKSTTTPTSRARGRPRGRGMKTPTASIRKRKSIFLASSDEDNHDDTPDSPPPTRSMPKRKAAKKSEKEVKSHFFAEREDETDLTDMTDRQSPKKKVATRGRGRGRGKGKAKT